MIAAGCIPQHACTHVLCARSISRLYPETAAGNGTRGVRDVSISLVEGDRLAVIGRSGSGKSTLARCLALLERADSGEMWIDAIHARDWRGLALLRRRVQLVLQDAHAAFNPRFTALDAVEEPLRYGATPAADRLSRAARLLDRFGISRPAAARLARDLSGGERRRVLLARAMATDPRVVILDETLASLDAESCDAILHTLFDLQDEHGFAIVLVGHDLAAARRCHRAALMDDGELCELGAVGDVLDHAHSSTGRAFAVAARRLAMARPC
jgi:peptide/nickel transport system ATP-binding protein